MPKKQVVVQSEAVVASSAPVRKRTSVKKAAAEASVPASDEKKAPKSKKTVVPVAAAVTHRHKETPVVSFTVSTTTPVSASVATPVSAPVVAPFEPSHDEVAKLAYSYYVARGYQSGDQSADWFRAVEELKARHAAATSLLAD
jgi:hypothetical protein